MVGLEYFGFTCSTDVVVVVIIGDGGRGFELNCSAAAGPDKRSPRTVVSLFFW